jgi:UDP-N-acetylglucosamine--N-acetylmuramyl-(pentapeptide) pyrophosphoryl-undecaprenol N-acetylglucosamine transferase
MMNLNNLKIIMTGGGSAGHVTPNLAIIPKLKEAGYEIHYIGTADGIERKIIEEQNINKEQNIKYHVIASGKLRRYFDFKNFTDPFKVIKGLWQAYKIIKIEKPSIIFSKGGFVAVPVVIGAYLNRVPVIAHESDITPGLANKLSIPYCTIICVTFPESLKTLKEGKAILTGTPIREEIFNGSKLIGLRFCNFTVEKPVLMVMGGSLGSKVINETIRNSLNKLIQDYNIIHICGKGNLDITLLDLVGYMQFEYVNENLPHLIMAADIVVSRAGANSIFEFLALKKLNILIPLSAKSSRGDQILNAESFEKSGYSMVVHEEELSGELLMLKLKELSENKDKYIKAMSLSKVNNGVLGIIELIKQYSK